MVPTYGSSSLVLVAQGVAVNHSPVAVDVTSTTLANEPVTIAVLANDSDPDGDPLSVQSVSTSGTAGIVAINAARQTVTYTPASGFAGTDTFRYTVTDGRGGSASATVTVTVQAAQLQVTTFTVPAALLVADPAQVPITWTVTNSGAAATIAATWTDQLILSTNATLGDADDMVVGQFTHSGALGPAGSSTDSYTATQTVTLPAHLSGSFNLFVVVDATHAVTDEAGTSTIGAGPAPITVTVPYAGLTVEAVGLRRPPRAAAIPSSRGWRVRNDGVAATVAGSLTDPRAALGQHEPRRHGGRVG